MMLRISGFKAHNHRLRVDPLMVISASNGAGKSAIAESIRFLALGYVPSLGKRPQDTASLLRGGVMTVSLDLDDGRTLSRSLEETPKGFRTRAHCSWIEDDRSKSHAAEILKLFGRDEEEAAESLDIRQLLSATPLHREARIAALLASSGGGAEHTADEATTLASAKGGPRPELEALRGALVEKLGSEGLEGALGWVNAEKRRLSAELLGKSRAEEEIEERLADLPRVSADELRDLEREAAELESRTFEARRHAVRIRTLKADLELAEQQYRDADAERDAFEARRPDKATLRQDLADLDRAIDAVLVPPYEDPKEAASLLRRAQDLETEAREIVDVTGPEPEEPPAPEPPPAPSPWSEVGEISARLSERARAEQSRFAYLVLTDAQRLEQLAQSSLRQEKSARAEEQRQEELDRQQRRQRAHEARERRARRDDLLRQAARARADAQELLRNARAAYQEAHGQAILQRRELSGRRSGLRQLLSQMEAADRASSLALERTRVELDLRRSQLEEAEANPPPPEDPARLFELRGEIETRSQARAARAELERMMSERARVEASRSAVAGLEWALQRIREDRLDRAGDPLVQGMTRILRAGGRRETPFLEASRGNCRVGWRTPAGNPVLIQAMSGGEWTLFASALAASMIVLRRPPLRFLFVEAGEADPQTLQSLLAGLQSVSGALTSVLVLTHLKVTAKGWTVLGHLPPLKAESA